MLDPLEVGKRLRAWRESLGDPSREAFAAKLDQPPGSYPFGTYRNHEMGKSFPNAAHLMRLAEFGCDIMWLVTGVASQTPTVMPAEGRAYDMVFEAGGRRHFVEIKSFPLAFSAGSGVVEGEEPTLESIRLEETFVRDFLRRDPEALLWGKSSGLSMFPTIDDGEALIMDTRDRLLTHDKIYAIALDQNLLLKRINRKVNGRIQLISDNKDYPPEDIEKDTDLELRVIGRVIWHAGVM